MTRVFAPILLAMLFSVSSGAEILWVTEGNRLHQIDLDRPERRRVLVEAAEGSGAPFPDAPNPNAPNRDVNGQVCPLPDGSGRFVAGEDTGQPSPPPGWGVFRADGVQLAKLTPTYQEELGEPHGCGFDAAGRLFTASVGNVGFGRASGQLLLWFPPFDRYPGPPGAYPRTDAVSDNYCKLATDVGTAGSIAIDREGRVYVASSGRGAIYRFSPPFPTGPDAAGGCGARDERGSPLAEGVRREVFARGLYTFSGLAFAPNGHLYAASVFTGEIVELDSDGEVVRKLLDPPGLLPPFETGTPQGIAVDAAGNVYYADLDLVWRFPAIDAGPNGRVRRIGFGADGEPLPPETLLEGLAFPDGVTVTPGSLP